MTRSLTYILFGVVHESKSFLEECYPDWEENAQRWLGWGSKLVTSPSSFDQIRKLDKKPLSECVVMGVTMYSTMSSAMNHIMFQKLVDIFF